jgi:hypothetical protein
MKRQLLAVGVGSLIPMVGVAVLLLATGVEALRCRARAGLRA